MTVASHPYLKILIIPAVWDGALSTYLTTMRPHLCPHFPRLCVKRSPFQKPYCSFPGGRRSVQKWKVHDSSKQRLISLRIIVSSHSEVALNKVSGPYACIRMYEAWM